MNRSAQGGASPSDSSAADKDQHLGEGQSHGGNEELNEMCIIRYLDQGSRVRQAPLPAPITQFHHRVPRAPHPSQRVSVSQLARLAMAVVYSGPENAESDELDLPSETFRDLEELPVGRSNDAGKQRIGHDEGISGGDGGGEHRSLGEWPKLHRAT